MIEDADSIPHGAALQADLCIVGAGAAGIAMALQFVAGGRAVLLLEAGGTGEEPATQALYEGELADARMHPPPHRYRQRRFGGTTGIWGGRCVPYDPIDFEPRPWMPGIGWPFPYATLEPWYARANLVCEAGDNEYTAQAAFPGGMRPMLRDFRGPCFTTDRLERFSRPTDFARRYRPALAAAPTVRLLLHANVIEIHTGQDGARAAALSVRTLAGRCFKVQARDVVLATGGIEVARLLLASRDHHAAGIGNQGGQLGRNYMCHIAGTIGDVRLDGGPDAVWHGYSRAHDGVYCRRRLALTAAAQRSLRIGNFVARLHHPRIPDPAHRTGALSALFLARPFISYEYSKRLHGSDRVSAATWLAHVGNVAADPAGTAGFLLHWLRHRTLAARKFPSVIIASRANTYSLDFHAEQAPNPDSRITLAETTDALGMQRVRVDWRYTGADIATVRIALNTLAEELQASNTGTLRFDPAEVELCATRDGAFGGHHIGTARMSVRPQDGVVDPDGRVHGVRNLYVASSAVFPTSSQANPTLTIVAMALRLAEHLRG